jgi:FkbM family methyltransferase
MVETLGKEKADYRMAVLSATDGDTVNYYQDDNTGNSMFKENTRHYANAKSTERINFTLDSIIEGSHLKNERIDVIKADVQGAELIVFQGGKKALAQATFVYFEGSTVEYNEGGACLYEVDAFLRSQGFHVYDFHDMTYNDAFKTRGAGQFDGKSI